MQKRRLPASPNKAPPSPPRSVPKGQPVPININLLVQGQHVGDKAQRVRSAYTDAEKRFQNLWAGPGTKNRPHSAHLDKHVLKSLNRQQSVDHSFYDKFERLDRDTVVGDMAIKEKGGTKTRARSAGRQRSCPNNPLPVKIKKRSQSASCPFARKPIKSEQNAVKSSSSENFFDLAMSLDDETALNTLSNAKRQISPRSLGIGIKPVEHASRRRPRSAKKSRDRSASMKRREASDTRSIGSASTRSNSSVKKDSKEKSETKERDRKSRSRTRRILPKCPDIKNEPKKRSPDRNRNPARTGTRSNRRSSSVSDIVNKTFAVSHIELRPFSAKQDEGGAYAYEYLKVGRVGRVSTEKRVPTPKRRESSLSAIDAVKKANQVKETLDQMKEIDRLMYPEQRSYMRVSSKLPKLKMIVAPTALPLASYVRQTSAKMLMTNAFDTKRKPVNV